MLVRVESLAPGLLAAVRFPFEHHRRYVPLMVAGRALVLIRRFRCRGQLNCFGTALRTRRAPTIDDGHDGSRGRSKARTRPGPSSSEALALAGRCADGKKLSTKKSFLASSELRLSSLRLVSSVRRVID